MAHISIKAQQSEPVKLSYTIQGVIGPLTGIGEHNDMRYSLFTSSQYRRVLPVLSHGITANPTSLTLFIAGKYGQTKIYNVY